MICFIQLGQVDKILRYCQLKNYSPPSWRELLNHQYTMDAAWAPWFASRLVDLQYMTAHEIVEFLYYVQNDRDRTTEFLLDYLGDRGDREEDYKLQTMLFEINLADRDGRNRNNQSWADRIWDSNDYVFTHYDKIYIGKLCEKHQLYFRALQHYTDINDCNRVLQKAIHEYKDNPQFLYSWFSELSTMDATLCLKYLMKHYAKLANFPIINQFIVQIAMRFYHKFGIFNIVKIFEGYKYWNGIYQVMTVARSVVERDKMLCFRFIKSAVFCGKKQEIEGLCRMNTSYDPLKVKEFLIESKEYLGLKDPRGLIQCCHKYGFIEEMIEYLYKNGYFSFILVYVNKMNQLQMPKIVGLLWKLKANKDEIGQIIQCCDLRKHKNVIGELIKMAKRYRKPYENIMFDGATQAILIDNVLYMC